jgi:hypothetical protein
MTGMLPLWTAEIIVSPDFARSVASIAGNMPLSALRESTICSLPAK